MPGLRYNTAFSCCSMKLKNKRVRSEYMFTGINTQQIMVNDDGLLET